MAHELPKRLAQDPEYPAHIEDPETGYLLMSADYAPDPDAHALAAEIVRRWNAHEQLVAALRRLTNEVTGCWGISEAYLRHELGNTNYQCVADKLAEARAALASADAPTGE